MDEQNMIQTSVQDNPLRSSINALKDAKESIKLRKADEQQKARVNQGLNLYEAWFDTQNEQLKKKYDVASRWAELAWMIVDYWKSKWITISWTDAEIIDTYLKGNPQKSKILYDYTHSNMDPEEFAIEMWRMKAPEPKWGFWRNAIWGAWDGATGLWQFIWNWAADIIWWTAKKLGADDERVDFLVNDFKKYLEDNKISKTVDANTDAGTYKVSKALTEFAEATGLWMAWKAAVEAKMGYPLITKASPTWAKAAVWAVEWAADMAIYKPIADQELASPGELALWAGLWAAFPLAWAWIKAAKKATQKRAVKFAEGLLQNMNRMTKGEQAKFMQRFGQNMGKRMNDRGLKTADDLIEYFTRSKNKVDNALSAINWRFTSKELDNVLDDSLDFAMATKNPQADRLRELWNKNADWGLTMSEINEVKRFFESHNKFNYLTKWTAEQSELATNMDSALREWQYKVAEKNWFSNLAELNKETAAAKEILNGVKKWEAWVVGNNPISLSDLVVAAWGGISPESLASMFVKKWLETPAAKSKIVDMLNWIGGHETMTEKVADLQRIAEVNSEKELDRLYKEWWVGDATPRLPENVEWGGVAAWERGFVTQNPSAPTYEEMWLQDAYGIVEDNSAWKMGTKMYDVANQKYKGIADDIIANWGATLDVPTLSKVWGDYYALSLYPNRNFKIPKDQFTDQHVLDYVEDNIDVLLQPWRSLWAWVSPENMVELDISTTIPKNLKNKALDLWKRYNQYAMYDLGTFEEIPTGWTWEPMDIDEEEVGEIINSLFSKKKK